MVTQLVKDYEDVAAVNGALDDMGHALGVRLVDDYFARAAVGGAAGGASAAAAAATRCRTFKEAAEVVAGPAMRMFLGVSAEVGKWNGEATACSLLLRANPLTEWVELPPVRAARAPPLPSLSCGCALTPAWRGRRSARSCTTPTCCAASSAARWSRCRCASAAPSCRTRCAARPSTSCASS